MASPLRSVRGEGPVAARMAFLWRAAKALARISPPVAAFLGRQMHELAEEHGVELPREAIHNSCKRCEAPLHAEQNVAEPRREASVAGQNAATLEAEDRRGSAGAPAVGESPQQQQRAKRAVPVTCRTCGYRVRQKPATAAEAKSQLAKAAVRIQVAASLAPASTTPQRQIPVTGHLKEGVQGPKPDKKRGGGLLSSPVPTRRQRRQGHTSLRKMVDRDLALVDSQM